MSQRERGALPPYIAATLCMCNAENRLAIPIPAPKVNASNSPVSGMKEHGARNPLA